MADPIGQDTPQPSPFFSAVRSLALVIVVPRKDCGELPLTEENSGRSNESKARWSFLSSI
jgi:hypothetical protein